MEGLLSTGPTPSSFIKTPVITSPIVGVGLEESAFLTGNMFIKFSFLTFYLMDDNAMGEQHKTTLNG